jgi:hypothetical protein
MMENPHIGVFLADFTHDLIGLHVNGPSQGRRLLRRRGQ